MYRTFKSVSVSSLLCFSITAPVFISGTASTTTHSVTTSNCIIYKPAIISTVKSAAVLLEEQADDLYDSIRLQAVGLNKKAFECAWRGYKHMLEQGFIRNKEVLSICDFSQSSRRKRLYVIDVEQKKVLINTYVAHGRRSGGEYASSFSNSNDSHKSSLGFYVTGGSYYGGHGLAMKVRGLEQGINDKADRRNIVIHGSKYVGPNYLRNNRMAGRSFGCPAVPVKDTRKVIQIIKDGSCLFIYHPTKLYLSQSKILNG